MKDPNATPGDRLRRLLDNLISRVIGFWVRIFTLLASILISLITTVFGLVVILVWPLLPVVAVWLALKGVGL